MAGQEADDRQRVRRRRVTLSQIAAQLDVSTATVSLALRDNPAVASETRKRVQDMASELGYIYNRQAASLRTARTYIVGVVVHDVLNPYFAEIFRSVEFELERHGLTTLICNHRDEIARQRTFVSVLQQQAADGLVLCPSVGSTAEEINRLVDMGMPVTMVCRDIEGVSAPSVLGDDFGGTHQLTDHLIGQGHKRIAMVGGRRQTSSGRERHAGYIAAMAEAGLPILAGYDIPECMTQVDGFRIADTLLALEPRPTAVVCFNDPIAFGIMHGLSKAGFKPGEDMAIVGFDNVDGAEASYPALTSVRNGSDEIGREAARAMIAQIEGHPLPFQRQTIAAQIEIRASSPPPKEI